MAKKQFLFIGDGVTPTGFSQVMHGIIGNMPKRSYNVVHLAVNYHGDPHEFDWQIYPADAGSGNYLGINRIRNNFSLIKWDGIFILNDVWVIDKYLKVIKESFKRVPPIVVYFPVDAKYLDRSWFANFDIVNRACVYTKFAYDEVMKVFPLENLTIIPHGTDLDTFKQLSTDRTPVKQTVFSGKPEYIDSFIFLNANRNQERKRYDLTLKGFSLFAKDKPENVLLYCHCGIKDVGWDIVKLASRYEVDNRLILTNVNPGIQAIPAERLNMIYNACDVGINTSVGEGWGLTATEHAVTGAVQIVPDHSACRELFEDCGVLIPVSQPHVNKDVLTEGGVVSPEDIANSLNFVYNNKDMLERLSKKCKDKFSSEEYTWKYIVKNQWLPVFEEVFDG